MTKVRDKSCEKWINSSFELTEKAVQTDDDGVKSIIIKGYANTVDRDRAGDVIPAEAWLKTKAMENYLKNPIVLFQHDHDEPIGKMLDYKIDDKGLYVEIEVYDVDKRVFRLIQKGALKAFSVGFRITDYSYDVDDDIFTITELELFEISVVSIPCNQESLFEAEKSLDSDSFKALKDEIRAKALNKGSTPSVEPVFNNELEKLAYALGYFKE